MTKQSVAILLGTRKGAFLLRSSAARERWRLEGPHFEGTEVNHLTLDARGEPTLYAAVNSPWWGSAVRMSADLGRSWTEPEVGIRFPEGSALTVAKLWQITPGLASQPGTVYAGVDPAALFVSRDAGRTWADVPALTSHSTRAQWNPGAGGLMVHSIVPHPTDPSRMHIAISAAGTFETSDGGATWEPRNRGVLADFFPEPDQYPEVGQCVHHLEAHPQHPEVLYQQNHCGVYRSEDGGRDWTDISAGLPSRFGFPILVHPHRGDTIFAVPEQGAEMRAPVGARLAVYRSRDRGAKWKRITKGSPVDAVLRARQPAGVRRGQPRCAGPVPRHEHRAAVRQLRWRRLVVAALGSAPADLLGGGGAGVSGVGAGHTLPGSVALDIGRVVLSVGRTPLRQ